MAAVRSGGRGGGSDGPEVEPKHFANIFLHNFFFILDAKVACHIGRYENWEKPFVPDKAVTSQKAYATLRILLANFIADKN